MQFNQLGILFGDDTANDKACRKQTQDHNYDRIAVLDGKVGIKANTFCAIFLIKVVSGAHAVHIVGIFCGQAK